MEKAIFQLEELTCPSCSLDIEEALNQRKGVAAAKVLFNSNRVVVTFDASLISAEELTKEIEHADYAVYDIKTQSNEA